MALLRHPLTSAATSAATPYGIGSQAAATRQELKQPARKARWPQGQPEQQRACEGRPRERGSEESGFATDASRGPRDEVAVTSSSGAAKAATASRTSETTPAFTLKSRGVQAGRFRCCGTIY